MSRQNRPISMDKLEQNKVVLSDSIVQYYLKFGQNRDLEKFLRLRSRSSSDSSLNTNQEFCPIDRLSKSMENIAKLTQESEKDQNSSGNSNKNENDDSNVNKSSESNEPKESKENIDKTNNIKVSVKQQSEKGERSKKKPFFNVESVIEISVPQIQQQFPIVQHLEQALVPKPTLSYSIDTQTQQCQNTSVDLESSNVETPIKPIVKSQKSKSRNLQENLEGLSPTSSVVSVSNKQKLEWDSLGDVGYSINEKFSLCNPNELNENERRALQTYFDQRGINFEEKVVLLRNREESMALLKSFQDQEEEEKQRKLGVIRKNKEKWQKIYEKYKEKYQNPQLEFSGSAPDAQSTPMLPETSSRRDEKSSQTSLVKNTTKGIQVESPPKLPPRKSSKSSVMDLFNSSKDFNPIEIAESFEFIAGTIQGNSERLSESSIGSLMAGNTTRDTTTDTTRSSSTSTSSGKQKTEISTFDEELKITIALLKSLLDSKNMNTELKKSLASKIIQKIIKIQTNRSIQTSKSEDASSSHIYSDAGAQSSRRFSDTSNFSVTTEKTEELQEILKKNFAKDKKKKKDRDDSDVFKVPKTPEKSLKSKESSEALKNLREAFKKSKESANRSKESNKSEDSSKKRGKSSDPLMDSDFQELKDSTDTSGISEKKILKKPSSKSKNLDNSDDLNVSKKSAKKLEFPDDSAILISDSEESTKCEKPGKSTKKVQSSKSPPKSDQELKKTSKKDCKKPTNSPIESEESSRNVSRSPKDSKTNSEPEKAEKNLRKSSNSSPKSESESKKTSKRDLRRPYKSPTESEDDTRDLSRSPEAKAPSKTQQEAREFERKSSNPEKRSRRSSKSPSKAERDLKKSSKSYENLRSLSKSPKRVQISPEKSSKNHKNSKKSSKNQENLGQPSQSSEKPKRDSRKLANEAREISKSPSRAQENPRKLSRSPVKSKNPEKSTKSPPKSKEDSKGSQKSLKYLNLGETREFLDQDHSTNTSSSSESRKIAVQEFLKPMTHSEFDYENQKRKKMLKKAQEEASVPSRSESRKENNLVDFLKQEKISQLNWIEKEIHHLKNLRDLLAKNEDASTATLDRNSKVPIYENLDESKAPSSSKNSTNLEETSNKDTSHEILQEKIKKQFNDWDSHTNMKKIIKNRSKLETPEDSEVSDESLVSFINRRKDKFQEKYEKIQHQVQNEENLYTKPYSSRNTSENDHYSEPNEQRAPIIQRGITSHYLDERSRKNSQIPPSTSLASSEVFVSSDSMSLPINNSTNSTTHPYHYKPRIHKRFASTQTTDSITKTQPIFEIKNRMQAGKPGKTPTETLRIYPWTRTELVDQTKHHKQLQTHPKSIKYTLTFEKRDKIPAERKFSSLPHPFTTVMDEKNSKEIINRMNSNSLDNREHSEKQEEEKQEIIEEEDITLEKCLSQKQPNTWKRFEERRNCIAELRRLRIERNEQRKKLMLLTSDASFESKLTTHLPPAPLTHKRLFTTKALRSQTKRQYKNLPEVQQRKEFEKINNLKRKTRLMTEIFNKNLQRQVLAGKVDLSNSVNLMTKLN